MSLKLKITTFFTFLILQTFGQSTSVLKYLGIIKVKNSGSFFYQVNLEVKGNKVSGVTITNAGNKNETTAALSGDMKNNGKKISFRETRIVKTAVKDKQTDFCFVNAELSLKNKFGVEVLEGTFIGKDEKGGVCAEGTIQLARKSAIMADSVDMTKFAKKLSDTLNKIKADDSYVKPLSEVGINKIFCGGAKKVLVKFYDGNVIDGDRIEISYNGKIHQENYTLTEKGIYIEFNVEKGKENIIALRTLNTGETGLNTVNIEVHLSAKNIESYVLEAEAQKTIKIKLVN